jgi:hypothetical protein
MPNEHHTTDGKFAANGTERERLLRIYQDQHQLPATGKMDDKTKAALAKGNETITAVHDAASAKLDEDTRDFFRRSIG